MAADGPSDPATVIGPGAHFEGLLSFRGEAVIAGRHRGDVVARGRLRVAEGGEVRGRIEVDELWIAGSVEGEIDAPVRVSLASTARVRGRIRTRLLSIEEGGVLDGRCRTLAREGDGAADPASDAAVERDGATRVKAPLQPSVAAPSSP